MRGLKVATLEKKNNAVYVFLSAVTTIAIFISRMHHQRKLFCCLLLKSQRIKSVTLAISFDRYLILVLQY